MLTGRTFFPSMISGPFRSGLHIALRVLHRRLPDPAAVSGSRGSRHVAAEQEAAGQLAAGHGGVLNRAGGRQEAARAVGRGTWRGGRDRMLARKRRPAASGALRTA